jgi:hypothetical protein
LIHLDLLPVCQISEASVTALQKCLIALEGAEKGAAAVPLIGNMEDCRNLSSRTPAIWRRFEVGIALPLNLESA